MKKYKKTLLISIITFILMFCINFKISLADVGSFESYDSGSSSGGSTSSWSSSPSYSSFGMRDYGPSESYATTSSNSGEEIFWIIVGIVVVAIIIYKSKEKNRNQNISMSEIIPQKSQDQIEQEIKASDPNFNKEEFLAWARDVFIKLQEAWTKQDWSSLRVFESTQLFEQHQSQLQGYIDRGQKNILDRVCVLGANLASFTQSGDKDIISITLRSKMIDYIIDEKSGQVLKGDKNTDRYGTYRMTFTRKTGVKTVPGKAGVKTTNCPNCGAPTEITSAGKCRYCGSLLVTEDFGWVLTDYTRIS